MRRAIEEERADVDHSIDVIDPALAAPGTGRPQAGGRLPAHNLETFRRLSGIDFVGCDVVQAISGYDPAGVTATPAASVGYEAVSLAALRRPGCEREAS
jgi:arginase family enzyme